MATLSIVIPIRKFSRGLKRLLESICAQEHLLELEVLIVLNSPQSLDFAELKDQLSRELDKYAKLNIQLYYLDQSGVNRARNSGLMSARGEIILFLDDDCELDNPHLLALHAQHHVQNPALFGLGGVYKIPKESGYFDRLYHEIQMRWLYAGLRFSVEPLTRYLIGGHFSIKSTIAAEYGIQFNNEVVYGGSELEFFLQAERKDLHMELSELSVLHHTHESFWSLNRKLYRQGVGKAISEKRFTDPATRFHSAADVADDLALGVKILLGYYNYVFWFGYYSYRQQTGLFFRQVLGDLSRFKSELTGKVEHEKQLKKNRGDRF